MQQPVAQEGAAVLREVAAPVPEDELACDAVQRVIDDLLETLPVGVGLAAPQIGVSWRIFVVQDRAEFLTDLPAELLAEQERRPIGPLVFVNPEIVERSSDAVQWFEGCLSVVNSHALVPRSPQLRLRSLDRTGVQQVTIATGWFARIIQHELDHLEGVLYTDHMRPESRVDTASYQARWRTASSADIERQFGAASRNE